MTISAQLLALKVPISCLSTDLQRRDLAKALAALRFAEFDKQRPGTEPIFDEWGYEEEIA